MKSKSFFFSQNGRYNVAAPPPPVDGPAAPTNAVIDNDTNNFSFTATPGYTNVSDYEYSMDSGQYWRDIQDLNAGALIVYIGNVDAPINTVGIRVKETETTSAGSILWNSTAFVAAPISAPFLVTGLIETTTTGSINQNSNVLTTAASLGVATDDYVIVEIGQEPGGGLRGTHGIDGTWPHFSYTSLATMIADNSKPSGFYAWVEENGRVYRRNGETGEWDLYTQWGYYVEKAIPISLRAKVVSVSPDGLTITLDRSARISVTNANVYYDNHAKILRAAMENDNILLPAGNFAIGEKLSLYGDYAKGVYDDFIGIRAFRKMSGAGKELTKLYSPKGCPSACIQYSQESAIVENLHVEGNLKDHGFGFDWWGMLNSGDGRNPNIPGLIPDGYIGYWENPYETLPTIQMVKYGCVANNIKTTNAMGYSFHMWGDNIWITNSDIILQEGQRNYQGWNLVFIGVIGGGADGITFNSPYISNAFEAALSRGVTFRNMNIVNGIAASNSSGGTNIENVTMTMTVNSKVGAHINYGHPFLDVNGYFTILNGHTNNAIHGININGLHMIHEGFVSVADNGTLRGISVGESQINVTVLNSSYTRPVNGTRGAIFLEEATNVLIDGFTITGQMAYSEWPGKHYADISAMTDTGPGSGLIKNVTGSRYIIKSSGVILENVDCENCV